MINYIDYIKKMLKKFIYNNILVSTDIYFKIEISHKKIMTTPEKGWFSLRV